MEFIEVHDGKEFSLDEVPAEFQDHDPDWIGCRAFRDMENYDPDYDSDLGFSYEFDDDEDAGGWGRHLWVYTEESGEPGRVAHLVQNFLNTFRPQDSWSLQYACTCSKPRIGEFSGGALFVTAEKIAWDNSNDFIERQRQVFEEEKSPPGRSGGAAMSRMMRMDLTITGCDAYRIDAIKRAADEEWPFVDWLATGDEWASSAEGVLGEGESDEEFARRLSQGIWQANGGYCKVEVQAFFLEETPMEYHCFNEAEYARLTEQTPS